MEGRWIAENTVIAQVVVHKIKRHKVRGTNGLILLKKIDLKKAYDRLEWSFIDTTLEAWGFSADFKILILSSVTFVQYSVLISGSIGDKFFLSRGISKVISYPHSSLYFMLNSFPG